MRRTPRSNIWAFGNFATTQLLKQFNTFSKPMKRKLQSQDLEGEQPSSKSSKMEERSVLSLLAIPSNCTSVHDFEQHFSNVAQLLQNSLVLHVNQSVFYRLAEIEFYVAQKEGLNNKENSHHDPFCHKNPIELQCGYWYFHRANSLSQSSAFKNGTRKGLDLTFGNSGTYGGILLRSMLEFSNGNTRLVEGPSKCVDVLLKSLECTSIQQFVDSRNGNMSIQHQADKFGLIQTSEITNDAAKIGLFDQVSTRVACGARVGLPLGKYTAPEHPDQSRALLFLWKPYRFSIVPHLTKKLKHSFLITHFGQSDGKVVSQEQLQELSTQLNIPPPKIEQIFAAFRRGAGNAAQADFSLATYSTKNPSVTLHSETLGFAKAKSMAESQEPKKKA